MKSPTDIKETPRKLDELLRTYRDTVQEPRIRMLTLLKQNGATTHAEIATILGVSQRSVQRWWDLYRRNGLEALLEVKQRGGKRPVRIGERELVALQQQLHTGGFSGVREAQEWLHREHGVQYSRSRVWELIRGQLDAKPIGWGRPHLTASSIPTTLDSSDELFSSRILMFLNSLPTTGEVIGWINQFRESLRVLLGDVDRISITVNLECVLDQDGDEFNFSPNLSIAQHTPHTVGSSGSISVLPQAAGMTRTQRLLEDLRHQGFPFSYYHPPHSFDYTYGRFAYLGTIFLWRERSKSTISQRSLTAMAQIEPFLVFALSDLVARHQQAKPVDRVFFDALNFLTDEARLSPQERRVITLQLLGHSYKEMADIMSITVDTVKKHFKQIHRKTETRSQAELFAKYFTARLTPRSSTDEESS